MQSNAEYLNLPVLKLKQDCPTRWNFTYDMLQRFKKMKNAFVTTLAIENPDLNNITVDEWQIIEKSIDVLDIFYVVTEFLCSEKHVSLSKIPIYVISIIENLNKHLSENNVSCIKKLCETILNEIRSRFGEVDM